MLAERSQATHHRAQEAAAAAHPVLPSYPRVYTSRRRRPFHFPSSSVRLPHHRRRIDPAALLHRPASRPLTARQLQSRMSRFHWSRDLTNIFLSALVEECREGNRPHKTLNRIGKANVVQRMRERTGRRWTWETCKHKWDELKRKWSCWKQLTKSSGIKFHPRTGLIDMPEHWWDTQIAANRHAKVFRHTRLDNEEQLDYIFAKMEPADDSPDEVGGDEGGRGGVPACCVESDSEYETFMRELLDGGVEPESEEYFMASEVLLDIPRRGAYRPLPTIEAKVSWIKRVYHSMKGRPPSVSL